MDCPHDCPCEPPKQGLQSQQQPIRSIEEVIETRGFARKNEDGRTADRRLANRRLQPLGHLTAEEFLSIKDIAGYAKPIVPTTVPEVSLPAIEVAPLRRRQHLPKRHEKGNGFSLNQASRQTAEGQAFARLRWPYVHQ
jgi:hypothetical protein